TERWDGLVKAMSRDMNISYEEADTLAPSAIPMGRIAEPEEVANLVAMMASPLTHYVNGTMIEIDGGQEKALMDRVRVLYFRRGAAKGDPGGAPYRGPRHNFC